jgi:hypothetical protein
MLRHRIVRAAALLATLTASAATHAIDFTFLQVGGVPAALCANAILTDVSGVAVSYNLLDNGGLTNVRFSWTITSAGPPISATFNAVLDPESAVQTDVQDWFDANFMGGIPVPGSPSIPWTAVIVASPVDAGLNPVGQAATFTVQCTGTGQASLVNIGPAARALSIPVPVDSPFALAALALALLACGMRRARR